MIKPISNQEQAEIPAFTNYADAILWFKDRYGLNFVFVDSVLSDTEEILYYYHLVLDRETYDQETKKLKRAGASPSIRLMRSFQNIEIHENGNVRIAH